MSDADAKQAVRELAKKLRNEGFMKGNAKEAANKAVAANEGDKVLKYADKLMEYGPLVGTIIQNLMAGFQQRKAEAQPVQEPQVMQPPEGYGTLQAAIYARNPDWKARAEAYTKWKRENPYLASQAAKLSYRPRPAPHAPSSRQQPELTNIDVNQPPPQPEPVQEPEVKEVVEKPKRKREKQQKLNDSGADEKSDNKEVDQMKALTNEMREDVRAQLQFAVDYIKRMDDDKFKEFVKEPEKLLKLFDKLPRAFMPFQLRSSIKETTWSQLRELFEQEVPEKFDIVKKARKSRRFQAVWEQIQQKV